MDTLSFLQRVLPDKGFYVTTVINGDGPPRQGFFSTVEELAKVVIGLDQRGDNTYFAISTFNEKGSRKKDNVRETKVVALDVDCGPKKPFPSWKEGLLALGKFVAEMQLPKPMVVHSGNGLHVYWTLTRPLPPDQWTPLAEALKLAVKSREFRVDTGLTANSSLVLRPVGTKNPKNGNTVKLLLDAEPVDPEVLMGKLGGVMPLNGHDHNGYAALNGGKPALSPLARALMITSDMPEANPDIVASKCQQIAWGIQNQALVPEPMWYAMLGVAAHCANSPEVAIAWSKDHPNFNADATLKKVNQWRNSTTGPATCAKFEDARPEGCKGCIYKGKITTPARLAMQHKEAPVRAVVEPIPASAATDIKLPWPFKRTASGIKITIDDTDIDLCPFDIYPVAYGKDETLGYETVRYVWYRKNKGWADLHLRQALICEGTIKEFTPAIADQGIVLHGKAQTERFQHMLRAYMDELRQQRTLTNIYANMGWKEGFTQFVIGDTIYSRRSDGSVTEETVALAAASSRLGHELYGNAGDLKSWIDFTKLTEKAKLYGHMFALCLSLSAPFYEFTGLKGLTISLYGPTGAGKTLAQLWMQSVWGNPEKLHFAAKFTQNALFSRMGLYCNMPVTIDEVTMMADKDVGDFLYWVSQGRDKARLNRHSEERDTKHFALPVVVSTNKSLHGKLVAAGLDSDAQMARLLEVTLNTTPLFTNASDAGRKLYTFISEHYGLVGREYVKKLLELGPDAIRAAIADAQATFKITYRAQFSGEERYWEHALTLAHLGGRLAHEWGLIDFDYREGIRWVLQQMGAIRSTVQENKSDAFDLLAEFFNDHADATITAITTGTKTLVDHNRLPRSGVYVRFDLQRKTSSDPLQSGVVLIDRSRFRKWLSGKGADYRTFIAAMEAEGIVATPGSGKVFLAKDSPIKLGQVRVVGINLNHPRLFGILDREEKAIEDLTLGQLRPV